jgi:hypothetical protein
LANGVQDVEVVVPVMKKLQKRMARLIASYDSEALCVNPRFPRLAGVYT